MLMSSCLGIAVLSWELEKGVLISTSLKEFPGPRTHETPAGITLVTACNNNLSAPAAMVTSCITPEQLQQHGRDTQAAPAGFSFVALPAYMSHTVP